MNEINANQLLIQMREMAARAQGLPDFSPTAETADFSALLKSSLQKVNDMQQEASQLAQRCSAGDKNVSPGDVTVNLQKANASFQTLTQVRNRLVSAYQEIMNMQI